MRLKTKIAPCILAFLMSLSFAACGGVGPSENSDSSSSGSATKVEHLGLYTTEDGTLMKDGKAYYAFGVNYFSLIFGPMKAERFDNGDWKVEDSLKGLETLASYGVKVVRFNIAGYQHTDWNYVIKGEKRYLAALDSIVDKAEELNIGLIPSFFWNGLGLTDYFDEPAGKALKTPDSKTCQFIVSFTEKIVQRYVDRPGIYGWEFGNEQNLGMDTPLSYWMNNKPALPSTTTRTERTLDDRVTSSDYVAALKLWAKTVAENDPYHRFIGTGDGPLRNCSYHWKEGTSGADTLEQYDEMLAFTNPDPISAVSYHCYAVNAVSSADSPKTLSDYMGTDSWTELCGFMVDEAKKLKKTAYLGETGYVYSGATLSDKEAGFTTAKIVSVYQAIADAVIETGVQLTMFWNYDDRPEYNPNDPTDRSNGTEWSWNERWDKGKAILEIIRDGNSDLALKYSV